MGLCPSPVFAQPTSIPAEHHPWGRFKPGAWQLVRVVTESLDENGTVVSASKTETRTTLMSIEDHGVTLRLAVVVDVAGKRFESEPQIVKQGFHGELICPDLTAKEVGAGSVTIEGRKIPASILQLECPAPTTKTVTKVYYSATCTPYVLRRESVTGKLDDNKVLNQTRVDVVTLDLPCRILAETKNAALVKVVNKHAKGTITTLVFTSTEMPGGIVSHYSKELDKNGRLVRRSTLELVKYGLEPEEESTGLFSRRKRRKIKPRLSPR